LIEKLLLKKRPKNRMNFDKTSPKKRNLQQQKISRNATKITAQLCEKTTQLATLPPTLHQFTILLSGISVSFSQLARSGNKLQITSSIDW